VAAVAVVMVILAVQVVQTLVVMAVQELVAVQVLDNLELQTEVAVAVDLTTLVLQEQVVQVAQVL
jgi:hypothetical protein